VTSIAPGPDELADEYRPDVFEGAAQILQALLIDTLEQDVRELARENLPGEDGRKIPYIFVTPRERHGVGDLASRLWRECYSGVRGFLRGRDVSTLGRFTAAGNGPVHGELMSFLFFAPEFTRALMEMGRADARHWLSMEHEDGPWRTGPPPG
jgi:NTE family protein